MKRTNITLIIALIIIIILIIIIAENLYDKVSSEVITDEKCLHMNYFSVLEICDTVFSIVFLIAILLHSLAIDAAHGSKAA